MSHLAPHRRPARQLIEPLEPRLLLTASLLADINLATVSSLPYGYTALTSSAGPTILFVADDGVHGPELWRTDSAAGGAALVFDINPGSTGAFPAGVSTTTPYVMSSLGMVALNGAAYFPADDGTTGKELWKTDGTAAGTHRVADLAPGSASSSPDHLAALGDTLFFVAAGSLYKLDTAVDNATPALVFSGATSFENLAVYAGKLYFSATDSSAGFELWSTDGSTAGTQRVIDLFPGTASSLPANLTVVGSTLYFIAWGGRTNQLWRTDGTAAGTVQILPSTGETWSYLTVLRPANNQLFFIASNGLWSTDGTTAGTVRVPGSYAISGYPPNLVTVGSTLYFPAYLPPYPATPVLCSYDPLTADGVQVVRPSSPVASPTQLSSVNGRLFLFATENGYRYLYTSDGTPAGTVPLSGPVVANSLENLTITTLSTAAIGSALYFAGADSATDFEPWTSDGTVAGTRRIADIKTITLSSAPITGVTLNGRVYFSATSPAYGRELWSTDGTPAGTHLVKDINPGSTAAGEGIDSSPFDLTVVGNTLFFTAHDPDHGLTLWKTDGTEAGTVFVADTVPGSGASSMGQLAAVDGTLFFRSTSSSTGTELWKSDGTEAGTIMLKEISPGYNSLGASGMLAIGRTLYFPGTDSTSGTELWKSDGTTAGTLSIADIYLGSSSSFPDDLTAFNGMLYFTANPNGIGNQLYKSDGTSAGTVVVKNIAASGLTATTNRLYFSASDAATGQELWSTDGTTAGTHLVKDINTGSGHAYPRNLTAIGSSLSFTADDGASGVELWKSDGTAAGTVMVKELVSGPGSASPSRLRNAGGTLVFRTTSGTNGQLWQSDGTSAGTVPVADISPLVGATSFIGNIGQQIVFSAATGTLGLEPYTVTLGPPLPSAIVLSPAPLTLLPNATQSFSAAVTDQFGNTLPLTPITWSTTAGSISAAGLLTASATPGVYAVTATYGSLSTTVPVSIFSSTVPSTPGNDAFTLRLALDGQTLEIFTSSSATGAPAYRIDKSLATTLTLALGDGDDSLTIDGTNGSPIGPYGLSLDFGLGNNTLNLRGGTYYFTTALFSLTGNLDINIAANTSVTFGDPPPPPAGSTFAPLTLDGAAAIYSQVLLAQPPLDNVKKHPAHPVHPAKPPHPFKQEKHPNDTRH